MFSFTFGKPVLLITLFELLFGAAILTAQPTALPEIQGSALTLSLEARVACQQAIEGIYWQHRSWPVAHRKPKPPPAALTPSGVMRATVDASLRLRNALER